MENGNIRYFQYTYKGMKNVTKVIEIVHVFLCTIVRRSFQKILGDTVLKISGRTTCSPLFLVKLSSMEAFPSSTKIEVVSKS